MNDRAVLFRLRTELEEQEKKILSPYACMSSHAVRKREEEQIQWGHRHDFSVDADRILHSLAYSRYIDKTQVFYLIKNDHITHRVLHVQLVSKIARTIGHLLRLNLDLIEAIALGHDIGHAPFGHDGEKFLSQLCHIHGIGAFSHNVQGIRFLQEIERKGRGWNLTLQVLDGIFSHDGEVHTHELVPRSGKTFSGLEAEIREKQKNPELEIRPMTLEGCVVRMADTISYVGRDIEDAIRLRLIRREEVPAECRRVLGDTNGTIVYTLVEDLVSCTLGQPRVGFSAPVAAALGELKAFNQEYIYENPKVKEQTGKIRLMFTLLFDTYLEDLKSQNKSSDIYTGFLEGMSEEYLERTPPAGIVRDFIAGMTDEYFLSQCTKNLVPQTKPGRL